MQNSFQNFCKEEKRVVTAAVCIISLIFPYVSDWTPILGIGLLVCSPIYWMLILMPVFAILYDLDIVKMQEKTANNIILYGTIGCFITNIYCVIEATRDFDGGPHIGMIINVVACIYVLALTVKEMQGFNGNSTTRNTFSAQKYNNQQMYYQNQNMQAMNQPMMPNANMYMQNNNPNQNVYTQYQNVPPMGQPLDRICPRCQKRVSGMLNFCDSCGSSMNL